MNKTYTLLAILLASAVVLYNIEPQQSEKKSHTDYLNFLKKYNKPIPQEDELIYRSKIYAEYVMKMERHNADNDQKWQMGVNQFSDLTQEEFIATYLGEMGGVEINYIEEPVNAGFKESIDWRNKGVVTSIRNQGQCGSCWAFAATAAHESYQVQFNSQPNTINYSEQQLVDCATAAPYSNHGCNGGLASRALNYIKDFGQTTESVYPYKAVNQECKQAKGENHITGVSQIVGCEAIEDMLTRRPMAVRVDASNWSMYRSGIFSNCNKNINHAVFMVGSTDEYWTIKNSWGPTWGEQGYIRLAKGDTCAVCQGPSFAI